MATIAEKLKTILDEKEKIKESLYLKGVDNVSNDWTQYADDIKGIGVVSYNDIDGIRYVGSEIETFPINYRFVQRTGDGCEKLFLNCSNLVTIPPIDTSMCTSFNYMFKGCSSLKSIPIMDVSNGKSFVEMFAECENLESIQGLVGLSMDLDLSSCTKLTVDSLVKIINNLATVSTSPTLTMGEANLAKLSSDEKQVALNKGWNLK